MTITPPSSPSPFWLNGLKIDPDTSGIKDNLIEPLKTTLTDWQPDVAAQSEKITKVLNGASAWLQEKKQTTDQITQVGQSINNVVGGFLDSFLTAGIKFQFFSPVSGGLTGLRRRALLALASGENLPNFDKNSKVAAIIITASSGNLVEAMFKWTMFSTILFGPTEGIGSSIKTAIENPFISPFAKDARDEVTTLFSNTDKVENEASGLSYSTMQQIKSNLTSTTLFRISDGKSPLSTLLGIKEEDAIKDLSDLSLNKPKQLIENVVSKVGKDIGDKFDASGLLAEFKDHPYDVWYDSPGLGHLFSGLKPIVDLEKRIANDIIGVGADLSSTTQAISDGIEKAAKSTDAASANTIPTMIGWLDQIPTDLSLHAFDSLWIPPTQGGTDKLRLLLTEWIKDDAQGAPQIQGSSQVAFMIVAGVPSVDGAILDALYAQMQTLFKKEA